MGVTSESELPCTDKTQGAKKKSTRRPRALCGWRIGDAATFWGRWARKQSGVVTGRRGAWEEEILYWYAASGGDPHQLGPAEETTDAHFEEKSRHPCAQDARWRLATRHACFFPHANLAPPCSDGTAPLCLWPSDAARGCVVTDARQNWIPEIASDDARVFGTRRRIVLHYDRRRGGDKYEPGRPPVTTTACGL